MAEQESERERLATLLKSHHTFPGEYRIRVVVRPELKPTITDAVAATVGEANMRNVGEQPSRQGAYVALRITFEASSAEVVLSVYDAVRGIDGVLAVM